MRLRQSMWCNVCVQRVGQLLYCWLAATQPDRTSSRGSARAEAAFSGVLMPSEERREQYCMLSSVMQRFSIQAREFESLI